MRAVAIARPGGPEVLQAISCATPAPQSGEVLIEVRAAGVNGHDLGRRRRGSHPTAPGETELPGLEVSATVVAVGRDGATIQVGDSVCALLRDWVQAAALPEAGRVLHNLEQRLCRRRAQAGGHNVDERRRRRHRCHGDPARELARQTVFATTRGPKKVAQCLSLGAKRVLDTVRDDFVSILALATHDKGDDVIVEVVAGDYLLRDLEAFCPRSGSICCMPSRERCSTRPYR